jgi:4-hydroxy-tetrahydrodipicolinate synthase
MSFYIIVDFFVTTIKTAVARRYDSMSSGSRNYGGTLNAEQCAAIDKLFS